MRNIKTKYKLLLGLAILFFVTACLEDFEPDNVKDFQGDLTVSGWLTNLPEAQSISVYVSTPLTISIPVPLKNLYVEVQDNLGNNYVYMEKNPGEYVHRYQEGEIEPGRLYKLVIITPGGRAYESDYVEMLPFTGDCQLGHKLDSVYTWEPGVSIPGLQFYTDFISEEQNTRYYKADVWETYEFHTLYNEAYWVKQGVLGLVPRDSIREVCYVNSKIPEILLIDTKNLEEKKIPDFPLHFVSNETQRLKYGYLAELRILSLTESAWRFWENQKEILEESGGLTDKQPPEDYTNISSLEDPDEKVLGYFGASAVSITRTFVPQGVLSDFNIEPYCVPVLLKSYAMNQIYKNHLRIAYFVNMGSRDNPPNLYKATKDCFDCTVIRGSSTEKPEFWNGEK